jgi:hypothetical protein
MHCRSTRQSTIIGAESLAISSNSLLWHLLKKPLELFQEVVIAHVIEPLRDLRLFIDRQFLAHWHFLAMRSAMKSAKL